MPTLAWWKPAAERAVKTFAQSVLGLWTGTTVGILDVDWTQTLSVSVMAGLLSVLTSVASSSVGGDGPSLTTEHVTPTAEPMDAP